jgi:thiamine-monophosphate kinase
MESDFIHWLRERLPKHPRLLLGPGDDAAILSLGAQAECVVTVDMLMDRVDFHLHQCGPQSAGYKALAVNLSDLAAMAARPLAALVSVCLPRSDALEIAQALYEGLLPLADDFDLAIAGGDTGVWDGPLVIDVTAIGQTTDAGTLLRCGARPGDVILVTGQFGGSILGHHLQFHPRVQAALQLKADYDLHAGTDVSDGLSLDLSHIAEESGCGAAIAFDKIPISAAARRLAKGSSDGLTALDHALADGEDFELILAAPPEAARRILKDQPCEVPITQIGTFIKEPGLWRRAAGGQLVPLEPRGYRHG